MDGSYICSWCAKAVGLAVTVVGYVLLISFISPPLPLDASSSWLW
jgi:hypothetical protein